MKKPLILLIGIILLLTTFFVSVYAHSGKTDINGGHYDRHSGEYHYHHGYPAHSHTKGECPYDFDDKTDQTPSNSNSNKSNDNKNTLHSSKDSYNVEIPTNPQKSQSKTPVWENIVGIAFGALLCSPLILSFLFFIYYKLISPVIEWVKKHSSK